MSSTIKLYEHNQKAYDALLDMLGERDRACVIKPTGTGKFVIIAKMVQDNPDKRFLLLGTNDYMFNDQMANLAEIAPGFTPENLQFMTYSAAMMTARRGEEISGYDVVVADEFHHCGAEEWDYEKNGNLTPSDIVANSNGTYWFLCRSCGASYKSYPGAKEPLCMGCMRKVRGRKSGKKVVCVETGTVYETVRDAGIQVGKHPSSISHALSDGGTCAGYHWQYLDE